MPLVSKQPSFKCSKLFISDSSTTLVDINFSIEHSLALVGESGSGKSLTLKSILGMLPDSLISEFEHEAEYKLIRGDTVAFVPQNPFTALSPLTKIRDHFLLPNERVAKLMEMVGLEYELSGRFAPELSGGQLQRVIIAMALSSNPKLLLLDEPTTALDPTNRDLMVRLLKRLQKERGFLMLFVTHDIAVAKELCEDILIIKEGKVVEYGVSSDVLNSPKTEYTRMLIEANFRIRPFRK